MKKILMLAAVGIIGVMIAGCRCGPNYLGRTVDDWQNNYFVEKPVITMLITDIVPVFPILQLGAGLVDTVAINPVRFWTHDAWADPNGGTGFMHDNPPAGTMELNWFER